MEFYSPLRKVSLLSREKRFFAHFESESGQKDTAHLANTGSLKTVLHPPQSAWVLPAPAGSQRKLLWSLEALQVQGQWVGVNTARANQLVEEVLSKQLFSCWRDYKLLGREVKFSQETRFDFKIQKETAGSPVTWVEVKSVTMAHEIRPGFWQSQFPDSVSDRATKHLRELQVALDRGEGAELVFVVQREKVNEFAPARSIDPVYADELARAVGKGLVVRVFPVEFSEKSWRLSEQNIPLVMLP